MQAALDSIVCHTPLNNLGFSRKGSALTFSVAFQALRAGLFEVSWCHGMLGWGESGPLLLWWEHIRAYTRKPSTVTHRSPRRRCRPWWSGHQADVRPLPQLSQHMKLKLQFTASVSHPPPEARPLSRKSSPSSPAVRDLVERHQASLGRSQSFSHQQPSRSHLMRYSIGLGTTLANSWAWGWARV